MPRQTLHDGLSGNSRSHPGDVSRRVAERREQLGLSREEVATRAGMTPGYVRYVEEQCHHSIGTNALLRLAGALRTTASRLLGGDLESCPDDVVTGQPVPCDLGADECWTRLSGQDVGRVALTTATGHPAVLPVIYSVVEGTIVYRTAPHTPPAAGRGTEVAFEVDRFDASLSAGWSVLLLGNVEHVTDSDEVRALARDAHPDPWADGTHDLWIRIVPSNVTGCLIRVD
ncbi:MULTISPECIES: helix-turn-helix domain-containing protein [unclassified Streptomyces]|uniref:helix-turn-helix domain-containing protein n=1 Tax=unclassified Streptomyces TaxID=2593676 RepID=UPI00381879B8